MGAGPGCIGAVERKVGMRKGCCETSDEPLTYERDRKGACLGEP